MWIGLFILFITMAYVPPFYKEVEDRRNELDDEIYGSDEESQELGEDGEPKPKKKKKKKKSLDKDDIRDVLKERDQEVTAEERSAALRFHFIMILACMYLGMLLTNL